MVLTGNDYGVCCPASLKIQKSGSCPAADNITECGLPCTHDLECPSIQKCCNGDKCGSTCVHPKNVTGNSCISTKCNSIEFIVYLLFSIIGLLQWKSTKIFGKWLSINRWDYYSFGSLIKNSSKNESISKWRSAKHLGRKTLKCVVLHWYLFLFVQTKILY